MIMNQRLYAFLFSNTFDVPDYEKKNIAYNSQLIREQFQEYFNVNFYHSDFKYHQGLLDEQIRCNKRIRQNVREAREMYADKSNPLYSRKTFKPKEVIPDAVKLNTPETLPMTYLCDHLLSFYHYMHDTQIADAINDLMAGENKYSDNADITVVCPQRQSSTNEGYSNTMVPLQFPKVAQRPRPIIMSTPVKPKDPQPPRPITETKPILKPTVISTTDLVGQILLQGFGSSSKNSELPQTTVSTVPTVVQTESTNRANNVVKFLKDSMKDTKTAGTVISTMTPRAAPSSISWDMNKVLTPRGVEKRQHDVQVEQAHAEIKAKRQRLSQWLGDLNQEKKSVVGRKKITCPMAKSVKFFEAKLQRSTEVDPTQTKSEPIKITIKKSRIL